MTPLEPAGSAFRDLPEPLRCLGDIALDLHWAWNHAGDALWRWLDEDVWDRTQNPWLLLQYVPRERLERLAVDPAFLRSIESLQESRLRYRATPPWRPAGPARLPRVAYFSMEFGLHEALPLYAGGLGVLAGDLLKTASDLDVPLVGIGILWQQGYFRQVLDAAGGQEELYPFNDPSGLPVQPVTGENGERLRISLNLPGRPILLRCWQVVVGRTMLYLLDSNDPLNAPADRGLTSALYGGGSETRLLQETILGIGGWRLLEAIGREVEVCHLNEGHAAFVVLERARTFMKAHGVTFQQALWATRAGNVFTTHTAVPAGFDTFTPEEIEKYRPYFDEYVRQLGVSWPQLLALGRRNHADPQEPFNMAWLAVRGCSRVNGVSQRHGDVSRRLFAGLFPRWPIDEVPIDHVTNGVHVPSWDSPWTDALWTRAAGKERWRGDVSALTDNIVQLSDHELWTVRAREREDLVHYTRARLTQRLMRQMGPEAARARALEVLHPEALTLGFARRFSGYKRPNLLLTDPDRLERLLTGERRPVQLIVAGKAHPRDAASKRLIQEWVHFAVRPGTHTHVVFLDDYDLRLATELVQGVDVWINTPRRPWEACGTSGMKVLVNGGLNLSALDGWWHEAFEPDCGWAICDRAERGDGESSADRDAADAAELYTLLEREIVPAFYERDESGLPRRWIAKLRSSMARLAPRFSSVRMLQEYVERAYLPGAAAYQRRAANSARLARDLDSWARHLTQHWSAIRFGEVIAHAGAGELSFAVPVHLGAIDPAAVRVEMYAAPDGGEGGCLQAMERSEPLQHCSSCFMYRATMETRRPAWHFTPRIVPHHPEARTPIEAGLISWQR